MCVLGFCDIYMLIHVVNTCTSDRFSTFEYGGMCFLVTIMYVGVFCMLWFEFSMNVYKHDAN